MSSLVTAAAVREYLALNAVSSDSKYSDTTLGSNIRAAAWTLARATGRVWSDETATKRFTTNGAAYLTIPGLRTASSVTLQSATLTADSTYWLVPDSQQTGVYTGIQFRAFGGRLDGPWWLANPEWFDRNLDSPWYPGNRGYGTSLPNDLSIAGSWGYATYADTPEPYLHAQKVLAAYYTKRPDALLSGAISTPDGNAFDLSRLPIEVQGFIEEWKVSPSVTGL
jgi:hypothetical protein